MLALGCIFSCDEALQQRTAKQFEGGRIDRTSQWSIHLATHIVFTKSTRALLACHTAVVVVRGTPRISGERRGSSTLGENCSVAAQEEGPGVETEKSHEVTKDPATPPLLPFYRKMWWHGGVCLFFMLFRFLFFFHSFQHCLPCLPVLNTGMHEGIHAAFSVCISVECHFLS